MNAFELNTRFLNKQNVQLVSGVVFLVVQVMHHLCKKPYNIISICFLTEMETPAGFVGHHVALQYVTGVKLTFCLWC